VGLGAGRSGRNDAEVGEGQGRRGGGAALNRRERKKKLKLEKKEQKKLDLSLFSLFASKMGGDDALGRPLGGACVPTQRLIADLEQASQDASLPQVRVDRAKRRSGAERGSLLLHSFDLKNPRPRPPLQKKKPKQSIRKLALDLSGSSAPSFEGLRAVYRALGVAKGIEKAPSLEEALNGKRSSKTDEEAEAAATKKRNENNSIIHNKPKDPALAVRLQALQDASDQAAYDACVSDLTENERRAASRSGQGLSSSLAGSASVAGLALAASAGTGFAAGFVAARALFPDDSKHPAARFIGGLIGLVLAIALEAGLVIVRAVRAENEEESRKKKGLSPLCFSSSSSSSSLNFPRITRRLTASELAAEAEVAAAVVRGAATAAEAGAEGKALEAAAKAAAEQEAAAAATTGEEAKKQR